MLLQAYKYYLLEESLLILQSSYVRMLNFLRYGLWVFDLKLLPPTQHKKREPEIHMNEKRPE